MFRFVGSPEMTFELVDPDGNVIMAGTPGYEVVAGSNMRLHVLRNNGPDAASGPIFPGGWEVRITGDGEYMVDVLADSSLHLSYGGRHSLPGNQPARIRASLLDEFHADPPDAVQFSLVNLHGDVAHPIELFDDGEHQDGQAGDGLWGGLVPPPPEVGLWRLVAQGALADGSEFRRIDRAPIRFSGHRMEDPASRPALPGSMREQTFTVFNDPVEGGGEATIFDVALFSSMAWTPTDTVPLSVTLMPGEHFEVTVMTTIPAGADLGVQEEVTLVAVPVGNAVGGLSATSRTTVVDRLPVYLPLITRPNTQTQ